MKNINRILEKIIFDKNLQILKIFKRMFKLVINGV